MPRNIAKGAIQALITVLGVLAMTDAADRFALTTYTWFATVLIAAMYLLCRHIASAES